MEINKIYQEDCLVTMENITPNTIDLVLTSPPYNTSRKCGKLEDSSIRYESFNDTRSDEEYIDWTIDIFQLFDKILKQNRCVLYNLSYSSENVSLMWKTVNKIIENTPFTIADSIVWKKKSAIPNNRTMNKLTRICEFVFVFCRKNEIDSFLCYKEIESYCPSGQPNYKNSVWVVERLQSPPLGRSATTWALKRIIIIMLNRSSASKRRNHN